VLSKILNILHIAIISILKYQILTKYYLHIQFSLNCKTTFYITDTLFNFLSNLLPRFIQCCCQILGKIIIKNIPEYSLLIYDKQWQLSEKNITITFISVFKQETGNCQIDQVYINISIIHIYYKYLRANFKMTNSQTFHFPWATKSQHAVSATICYFVLRKSCLQTTLSYIYT
jgi:hypothetical protein